MLHSTSADYLDRDSLGALTGALIEFGGGVIIISHQFEFTNAICKEKWVSTTRGWYTGRGGRRCCCREL
jgi:ATPase subunit of ABC transporter with duplicated ATPase domains